MSNESIDKHDDLPQGSMDGHAEHHQATPSAGPSSQPEPAQQQQTQAAEHSKVRRKKKTKRKNLKPLHHEPLSAHTVEKKLARMRAAIAAGADVNGLDESEPICHREGRPLDACLRVSHMPNGPFFYENVHAIELLLEHGADPRLRDVKYSFITPLEIATFAAERDDQVPRARVFYERVVAMFKEAIAKLEEKEKSEKGEEKGETGEEKIKPGEEKSELGEMQSEPKEE